MSAVPRRSAKRRPAELVGVAGHPRQDDDDGADHDALAAAGLDPTVFVGGARHAVGGQPPPRRRPAFVVEADEYDRSFLALSPTVAVVTNIEADHLDIYADLDDIIARSRSSSAARATIVLCADDPGANALPTPREQRGDPLRRYLADARLQAIDLRRVGRHAVRVVYDGEAAGEVELAVPGRHNVRNALAALAVGLGAWRDGADMARGLAAFAGVERGSSCWAKRRRARRGRLRAPSDRGRAPPSRRRASAFRTAGSRGVPAPPVLAHAGFRARVRRGARCRRRRVPAGHLPGAGAADRPGVTSDLIADVMAEQGRSRPGVARAAVAAALAAVVRPGDLRRHDGCRRRDACRRRSCSRRSVRRDVTVESDGGFRRTLRPSRASRAPLAAVGQLLLSSPLWGPPALRASTSSASAVGDSRAPIHAARRDARPAAVDTSRNVSDPLGPLEARLAPMPIWRA